MSKICIADDDADIIGILQMMLQTRGHEVIATTNPTDLLTMGDENPDLVILDLWMSGIDGRDILTSLRSQESTKHIPIVFMSANASLREIAAEYHADDFIEKPFDMSFMLNKIQEVISRSK